MRVRVQRMESIKDPSGALGKRVELVEENVVPSFAIKPPSEEARIVQDVFRTMQQQIPMLGVRTQVSHPKIILFLTEQEYEKLGVQFDVNQVYEVELSGQSMNFKKVS
ncbi:MAG: arcadin 1 [Candidatus Bathyarchaeota archaeon]|nr:arcadin 1 [Candidatus Bathyarchaeota archaeon]